MWLLDVNVNRKIIPLLKAKGVESQSAIDLGWRFPTKTVGPFANAVGVQRVCTIVSCNGTNSESIIKTTTRVWKHPSAITPETIVKSQTFKCTMGLRYNANESSKFPDACDYNQSRSVQYEKESMEVQQQTMGQGNAVAASKFGANSSINVVSSIAKGTSSMVPATCTSSRASRLSVSLKTNFCDKSSSMSESLTFSNVDLTAARTVNSNRLRASNTEVDLDYSLPGVTSTTFPTCPADIKRKYSLDRLTGCEFSLVGNKEDGVLIGTGECLSPFKWYNVQTRSYESLTVKSFSFVCRAPDNFDFSLWEPN